MKRICITAFVCFACTSAVEPTGSSRAAIVGGTPSDSSQDFVIVIANTTDAKGLECNADLVAPNLLVTARHCVAVLDETKIQSCNVAGGYGSSPPVGGDYPASHFVFATDEDLTKPVFAKAIRIFDSGTTNLCGADIAFVLLDRNLDSLPVAPIATTPVSQGDTLTVVGSGQIDATGTQATTRMQRTGVTVLGVGPTAITGANGKEAISDGEFGTDVAFCNGDSGGPAIDAQGRITGLVSRTPSCTSGPDVFTSIAAHLDVAQTAFAAAGQPFPSDESDGGAEATDDAGDVPVSSSGCSLAPRDAHEHGGIAWHIVLLACMTAASCRRAFRHKVA